MGSQKVLHLFSGGRDSLLAACLLLERGYEVELVTFDNGCTHNLERAPQTAKAIKKRYSDKSVKILPTVSVAMTFHRFMYGEWMSTYRDLAIRYPHLQMYQVHCLACKTAMYVHAIAYCKAHNIGYISDGARESQGFFVELPEMVRAFQSLCGREGIQLINPVYELESDLQRAYMLDDRGLDTNTFEPQCFLGCPMPGPLSEVAREEMLRFYTKELLQIIDEKQLVNSLVPVKCDSSFTKEVL